MFYHAMIAYSWRRVLLRRRSLKPECRRLGRTRDRQASSPAPATRLVASCSYRKMSVTGNGISVGWNEVISSASFERHYKVRAKIGIELIRLETSLIGSSADQTEQTTAVWFVEDWDKKEGVINQRCLDSSVERSLPGKADLAKAEALFEV